MKKILCAMLAAVLILGIMPLSVSAAELPFTDVAGNAWYAPAVGYVYQNGLFNGTSDSAFSPGKPMTRGMFVQVLANKTSNYRKEDWTGTDVFSDVASGKWYSAPVAWASRAGLVDGTGNGEFSPNHHVTRQQMAVILYKYAKASGNDTTFDSAALDSFPDAAQVAPWAEEAMRWAVTHKIINGSGGRLNPKGNATRCQVAQVFQNADSLLVYTEVEADPNGMFSSMEEYLQSDAMQKELEAMKESLSTIDGISMDVYGEGNKLYFDCVFTDFSLADIPDPDVLANALDKAVDENLDSFGETLTALSQVVDVAEPTLVMIFRDKDGEEIYSCEII